VVVFGPYYLREPNVAETTGITKCTKETSCYAWKHRLHALVMEELSTYKGHHRYWSVVLKTVTNYDLWIWHTSFDIAGSHNDINAIQRSPLFSRLAEGHAP
jgi:hypothetical protein